MNTITQCRVCRGEALRPILDLGQQPAANALSPTIQTATRYPLQLMLCTSCFHSQLSVVVPPEELYSVYYYASSTIPALVAYFDQFVQFVTRFVPTGRVLEIACNDGAQLMAFQKAGWLVTGVDPARNLVQGLSDTLNVQNAFWGLEAAQHYAPQSFDAVVAQNVLGHVNDPTEFLEAIDRVLAVGGRVFLQTSHANWLPNGEFDTIYHEHLSYFNCNSWAKLLEPAWTVEHLWLAPSNGTSYVLVLGRKNETISDGSFERRAALEQTLGYLEIQTYMRFAEGVRERLAAVKQQLDRHRSQGWHMLGYGAAAKGVTLLSALDAQLAAVVDDSPIKQGKYLPGINTPVVGPAYLDTVKTLPLFVIVTAWLYRDEIKASLHAHGCTGLLCSYLPELQLEAF